MATNKLALGAAASIALNGGASISATGTSDGVAFTIDGTALTIGASTDSWIIQNGGADSTFTSLTASAVSGAITMDISGNASAAAAALGKLTTGTGADKITIGSSKAATLETLATGAGNDDVVIADTEAAALADINLGTGNDTLHILGTGDVKTALGLNMGAGNDYVNIEKADALTAALTITLGAGADTLKGSTAVLTSGNVVTADFITYSQGDRLNVLDGSTDTIKLTETGYIQSVDASGTLSEDSSIKASTNGTDIYQLKTTLNDTDYELWTAVNGSGQAVANATDVDVQMVIDVSKATAATVAAGTGKATITGASDGTTAIWSNTGNDTISLVAGATSTDTVWFEGSDGQDTVLNFENTRDRIYFWNTANAAELIENYDFSADNGKVVISGEGGKLTLTNNVDTAGAATDGTGVYTLRTADGNLKTNIGEGTWLTSTQLYAAVDVVSTGAEDGNVAAFLGNTWTGVGTTDLALYDDVHAFNASKATGKVTLIGNTDSSSTLTGGTGTNAYWGGSANKDTFIGSTSAVDTIWFGTGDGADRFTEGADKGDVIYLYDVNSIEDVKITLGTNQEILTVGDSTLTITDTGNTALLGGLTIQLSDGSKYKYNTESSGGLISK